MRTLPRNTILVGDVTRRLAELPPAAVDCVITSPPYYRLRDYGVAGQLGLEATVDDWVQSMRRVTGELARVLKPTGGLWLNLDDVFSHHRRYGAPSKSLLLAPERLLVALAGDGWYVRNKVIWAKPNPMPVGVTDRLAVSYEVVYFLTRSPRYTFHLDAIRVPVSERNTGSGSVVGKNPGDVWTIPTRKFRGAHFATFPAELVRRPLLATCPEAVCTRCGRPWRRAVVVRRIPLGETGTTMPRDRFVRRYPVRLQTLRTLGELVPCGCDAPTRPGVVLDPFFGTGTVGEVARAHGRDWLGIELNPAYVALARARLGLDEVAA